MKAGVAALLLVALVGCATRESVKVSWLRVDDPERLCALRYPSAAGIDRRIVGCAFWDKNVCVVVAPDRPDAEGDTRGAGFGVLGHEVKHCFDGMFHD